MVIKLMTHEKARITVIISFIAIISGGENVVLGTCSLP